MKAIWKYPLDVTDYQTLELPAGAEILTVQAQREVPCLWALVDTTRVEVELFHFHIFGTGHDIPDDFAGKYVATKYVATFQLKGGSLVFHVFQS